jgi:thiosulfate reductase cytochrome b subunit
MQRIQKKFSAQNPDKKIHAEKYSVSSMTFPNHSASLFNLEKTIFIHIHFPEINVTVHKISDRKKLIQVHFNCIFSFYIRLPKYFFYPLFTTPSKTFVASQHSSKTIVQSTLFTS